MSYIWQITDPKIVNEIKSASIGQRFKTSVFSMHNLRWYVEFWPNGQNQKTKGLSYILLRLTSLSPKVKSIQFGRKYAFIEANAVHDYDDILTHERMYSKRWPTATLKTNDLQKYNQYTLRVDVELYAVYDKDGIDKTDEYLHVEEGQRKHVQPGTYTQQDIVTQMEQMKLKMYQMQQKMNAMELRLNEEQKYDDIESRLNNMMNEIKLVKQTVNQSPSNSNMKSEQQMFKTWLDEKVQLPQYYDVFIKNGIDELSIVSVMDKVALKEIGIHLVGHQLKILSNAKQLSLNENDEEHEGSVVAENNITIDYTYR